MFPAKYSKNFSADIITASALKVPYHKVYHKVARQDRDKKRKAAVNLNRHLFAFIYPDFPE